MSQIEHKSEAYLKLTKEKQDNQHKQTQFLIFIFYPHGRC